MSDEANAPVGGEVASATPASTPANDAPLTVREAFASYTSRTKRETESPAGAEQAAAETESAPQADAAPAEQAPGEVPEAVEPAEKPLIEPPRSWTKEAKERWNTLPPETQEYLATREQERDREVRRSQNEAADKLKAITAKEQEAERVRQQYEAKLPALLQALHDAQSETFSDIKTMDDVKRMALEDPFRKIQWDTHQQALQAVALEAQQAEQRKAQERQNNRSQYEAEQNKSLIELVPDMADPKKAGELRERAVAMLTDDLGLKTDQLSRWMQDDTGHEILSNAGIQKLIVDGLRYRDIQNAKTVAAAKPVPQVQRPGVAQPKGAAADANVQALSQRLNSSGSIKDAFALYQAKKAAG